MKFYISYFYQIRFFTPNMVPVSTAMWDPKWYRRKVPNLDKNGVLIGCRAPILNFPSNLWEELTKHDQECRKDCPFSTPCLFMKKYKEYLDTINFDEFIESFQEFYNNSNIENLVFVLIVHEAPWRKCAERPVLQEWFKEHGIELKEWDKNLDKEE